MITPRLQSVINHITTKEIADIGTDHAYIPIYLAQNNLIKTCIATDKNEGPLKIAQENIKRYSLSHIIKTRLGAGLLPIKEKEVKECIIAGMGGVLILKILNDALEKAKDFRLILQPMNAQEVLREFLLDNGFTIDSEDLSKEGFKVYNSFCAIRGEGKKEEEIFLHLPKVLQSHKYYKMLFDKKKREFEKIISGQKRATTPDFDIIKKYEKLLNDLKNL